MVPLFAGRRMDPAFAGEPIAGSDEGAHMADDIAFLPATRLIELYRAKQLSPVEVISRNAWRGSRRYEGALNAFVLYDPESAMAAARASEARWQKGEPQGLLDGIPVAIKDTQLTRGWPRLRRLAHDRPEPGLDRGRAVDRAAARRRRGLLRQDHDPGIRLEGGHRLAAHRHHPQPVEPGTHPGGSSGGSAGGVLAGICPLAVGTDAGGSIRIPAAFSGVFGLKPTFGRVAVYPPSAFGDVAHVGPMTRTVADAALMLDAMKGPDARDWYSLPDDGIAYRDRVRGGSLKGKRIALSPTLGYAEPAPAVRDAVERAAKVFAEPRRDRRAGRPVHASRRSRFSRPWRSPGSGRCCAR